MLIEIAHAIHNEEREKSVYLQFSPTESTERMNQIQMIASI